MFIGGCGVVVVGRIFHYYFEVGFDRLPDCFLVISEVICMEGDLYTLGMIVKVFVLDKDGFDPSKFDRYVPPFLVECNPKVMYRKLITDFNLDEVLRSEYVSYEAAYGELVREKERYLDFLRKAVSEKLGVNKIPDNVYGEVVGWDIILVRIEEEAILHMRVFGDYKDLVAFMERIPVSMRNEYMYKILKPQRIGEIIYSAPEDEDDIHFFRISLE